MKTLEELLAEKKPQLLKKWVDLILNTYPLDAHRLFKHQKDQFLNPVGSTISREIAVLFDELIRGINPERASRSLDGIIRIRAIQEFSPAQAISFIYILKKILREETLKELREYGRAEQLLALESRLDEMALLAFDLYMRCREKMYEIRANEAKNQVSALLRKKGLLSEAPAWKPAPDQTNLE
jgi:hypothetical protein